MAGACLVSFMSKMSYIGEMANDTYKGVGWCIGFLAGWVLEARYINFSTDVSMMTRMMGQWCRES